MWSSTTFQCRRKTLKARSRGMISTQQDSTAILQACLVFHHPSLFHSRLKPSFSAYPSHCTDCVLLFFSRHRSEGWPQHGRTFSIYPCHLSFWLTLPRRVLSTSWCCPSRPCVAFLACVHLALFLALSLTVAFLFFFRTDSTDSPDCLPILLSISSYFLVFLFSHFLAVGSMR